MPVFFIDPAVPWSRRLVVLSSRWRATQSFPVVLSHSQSFSANCAPTQPFPVNCAPLLFALSPHPICQRRRVDAAQRAQLREAAIATLQQLARHCKPLPIRCGKLLAQRLTRRIIGAQ